MTAARKYIIDTNCYIDATRNREFAELLFEFATRVAPGLHVSAVVLAELEAGMRGRADRKLFGRNLVQLFAGFHRVVTPTESAWRRLGEVIAELRTERGVEPAFVKRSFAFDVLLACSCREIGATLVTRNARDFARIADLVGVDVIAPFGA